jgi:hypothetical protein
MPPVGTWEKAVAILVLAAVFGWLYLAQPFIVKNRSAEAIDIPLTVECLEQARQSHVPASVFLSRNLSFEENLNFGIPYLGFFAFQSPLLCVLYLPFVKLFGIGHQTVTLYSLTFCTVAWLTTGLLAFRMFDWRVAALSMFFLITNLLWLIHVHVAYAAWMPSVVLMNGLVLALHSHLERPSSRTLWLIGSLLSLMFLVGWLVVVFGAMLLTLTLLLEGPAKSSRLLRTAVWIAGGLAITALLFTVLYMAWTRCRFLDIYQTIWWAMTGRYSMGAIPNVWFSSGEKIAAAVSGLFLEMRQLDHPDKFLAGRPSLPPCFTVFFCLGLLYCLKDRTTACRLLLISMAGMFGIMGAVFQYAHRYALLALPVLSIVAARGLVQMTADLRGWRGFRVSAVFGSLVGIWMGVTLFQVHRQYYVDYIQHKRFSFEADRLYGHFEFSEWLKQSSPPSSTVVVLGNPVIFSPSTFLFNTHGWNYPFAFWNIGQDNPTRASEVKDREAALLQDYRRIVYVFQDHYSGKKNSPLAFDPQAFFAAHPGIRPSFFYCYDGHRSSFSAYIVERTIPSDSSRAKTQAPQPRRTR